MGLLLISGLLVVGIIWTSLVPKTRNKEIETEPVTTTEGVDLFLPADLKRPVGINWENFEMDEITTTDKVEAIVREWSREEIERGVMALGENIKSIGQTGNWTTFGNEKRGGFIDRLNNLIEWQKRIDNREEIPKGKLLDQDETEKKITEMVEKIGGEKVMLILKQIKYVKVVYPQWVECPRAEADMVMVRADMEVEGKKITSFYGEMVTATIGRGGEIMKLALRLPPKFTTRGETMSIKTEEEIKTGRISNFGIKETDAKWDVETNNLKVNATMGELVYIYEAKSSRIKPYWIIGGNSFVGNVPIRVSMLYSATK